MGTFFVSDLDSPPIISLEDATVHSTSLPIDASPISSIVLSDTEANGVIPVKLEMDEESSLRCKRLKLVTTAQQCIYLNVPEKSPLGLTLRKTPSFLSLVEAKLSHPGFPSSESKNEHGHDVPAQLNIGKSKASNFCASFLRIGSWERASRYEGELVAKCYYAKRKLVWEVLDGGLKNKIELPWSDISSLRSTSNDGEIETLEIELLGHPLFFRETNPQPRKHTLWKATADFTGGQASMYRRHFLQFPQGTLQKHYEKLLKSDERLSLLSKKSYPTLDSPFFGPEDRKIQHSTSPQFFGFEEQNSNLLKVTSGEYSKQLQSFNFSGTPSVLCQISKLQHYGSEISLMSDEVRFANDRDEQYSARVPFWQATIPGASKHVDCETSMSIANMFPNIIGSILPRMPKFNLSTNESHPYERDEANNTRIETSDDNHDLLNLVRARSYQEANSDNSAIDLDSSCQIPDIQNNWNFVFPVGSYDNFGSRSEFDGYVNLSYGFSRPREVSREISGQCTDLFENVSTTTSLPVLFVKNPLLSNELEEVRSRLDGLE